MAPGRSVWGVHVCKGERVRALFRLLFAEGGWPAQADILGDLRSFNTAYLNLTAESEVVENPQLTGRGDCVTSQFTQLRLHRTSSSILKQTRMKVFTSLLNADLTCHCLQSPYERLRTGKARVARTKCWQQLTNLCRSMKWEKISALWKEQRDFPSRPDP